MTMLVGFPQFPDENFEPKLYNELVNLHLAITNLDNSAGLATGVDTYASNEWASLGVTGAFKLNNVSRIYVPAGAAIARGEVVNLYDSGGVLKARLAKADNAGTMAMGIANNTVAGINDMVEVLWLRGVTDAIGGLDIGGIYYLDAVTAGRINRLPPVTSGHIIQTIGMGVFSTRFLIDISLTLGVVP